MSYYNHYNLDEIAEQINFQDEIYQMQFIDLPIYILDLSRTHLKVIFDGLPQNKSKILQQIETIYSVGRSQFRQPNEISIFMDFPIYDFFYLHNKILEAIDNASNPNFSLYKPVQ